MLALLRVLGEIFGRFAYWLGIRSQITRENIDRAFPEWSDRDRRRMAVKSHGNLGAVFFEFLYLRFASKSRLEQGMEIINLDEMLPKIFGPNGAILLSGHLGNWEWLALGCGIRIGAPLHVIIKNQRSSRVERFLIALRVRFGNKMIDAGNVRAIYRAIRNGKILAILGDQTASPEEALIPFFGREVPTFEGTARVALNSRAPILFLHPYERTRRGYRARFREVPFDDLHEASPENIRELTARHTRALEQAIREKPELWLWQHRRWKHART